jgi:methylmalonyl-CoA/ethylmalonyl-CoA epimerase
MNVPEHSMRFHHVGYAVADIAQYLDSFMRPLMQPLAVSELVADPIQRVRVCFVTMQGGTVIELVEPLGEGSPVHEIVGSNRGGLYHVCYEVDDLEATLIRMRKQRCLPLGKAVPAAAFGGRRIVFLMTPQRDLIELLDAPHLSHDATPIASKSGLLE